MYTNIVFVDNEFQEIESVFVNTDLKQTLDMILQISEFRIGTDRIRYHKSGWICVDFQNNEIEVQVLV